MRPEPVSPELALVDPELAHRLQRSAEIGPFRIVFVCTGNRFRSALAAVAFRTAAMDLPVEVDSFGTLDVESAPPLSVAVAVGASRGLDLSGHVAKSLVGADLSGASLVVGFEPQHLTAAVDIAQADAEQTFLLRELLDLLEEVGHESGAQPVERAIEAVAHAKSHRKNDPGRWRGREIGDPLGLPQNEQDAIGHVVCDATIRLVQELFGTNP